MKEEIKWQVNKMGIGPNDFTEDIRPLVLAYVKNESIDFIKWVENNGYAFQVSSGLFFDVNYQFHDPGDVYDIYFKSKL